MNFDFFMKLVDILLAIPFGLVTGIFVFIIFHNIFLTEPFGRIWVFSPLKDIIICFMLAIITYALLT